MRLSVLKFAMFLCVYVSAEESPWTDDIIERIDKYIDAVMKCRNIPALNLVLVKNGQELTRGYGVLDLETKVPVDREGGSVFCVASLSKGFTTTLLAKLISENKGVSWGTPISEILGNGLRFPSEYMTEHASIQDLVSHRMGIARYDWLWFSAALGNDDLLRRLEHAEMVAEFRDKFIYNNLFYGLAARVSEKLGQKPWTQLVQENIFNPLGMKTATFVHDHNMTDVFAKPYITVNQTLKGVDIDALRDTQLADGAIAVCASAKDMSKWVKFHLYNGQNETGDQLLDHGHLRHIYSPRTSISLPHGWRGQLSKPTWPVNFNLHTYGSGWMLGNYRGHNLVYHGGSLYGYRSWLAMFPDTKSSVYISWTAQGTLGNLARAAITFYMMDLVLDELPWLNKTSACQFPEPWEFPPNNDIERTALEKSHRSERSLEAYVGNYGHKLFGNLTISRENSVNNSLLLNYGRLAIRLYPSRNKDVFFGETFGELWFMWNSDHTALYGRINITFSSSSEEGPVDHLHFPFLELTAQPVFKRDLIMEQGEQSEYFVNYTCNSLSFVSLPSVYSILVVLVMSYLVIK